MIFIAFMYCVFNALCVYQLQAFAKMFKTTPDDLDMHVIYDVSHNIAKVEEHFIDNKQKTLLVHRKGSTRAFPPHHPLIPVDYQVTSNLIFLSHITHWYWQLNLKEYINFMCVLAAHWSTSSYWRHHGNM